MIVVHTKHDQLAEAIESRLGTALLDLRALVGAAGTFCGQSLYFESRDVAEEWASARAAAAILGLADAFRRSKVIWADPLLTAGPAT